MSLSKLIRSKEHFGFLGLEGLIQGIQFIVGIAIIRFLPKEEYAIYVLGFSVISITGPLTSTGLVGRFNRLAGPLVSNPPQFANALQTLISLRQALVSGLLPILLILAVVLFQGQHLGFQRIALLVLVLVGYFYLSVASTAYAQAARLTSKFNEIQLINLAGEIIRGVAVGIAAFIYPRAEVFLIASAFTAYVVYRRLRTFCRREGFEGGHVVADWRQDMLKTYWKLLPNSVFSVLQDQITTFVLGLAGTGAAVGELGAISRWGRMTQPIHSYIKMVVSPNLSKGHTQAVVWHYWRRWLLRVTILSFLVVAVLWSAAPLLIRALGPGYSGLERELCLYAIMVGIDVMVGYLAFANEARGYYSYSSRFRIPGILIALIASGAVLDITTVAGAILMGLSVRIVVLLLQFGDWFSGMKEDAPTPLHRV